MKVIAGLLLAVMFEGVYLFYDWKGRAPSGPNGVYRMMPSPVQGMFRGAGRFWSRVTARPRPVTLLPDHVTLCMPVAVRNEWKPDGVAMWAVSLTEDAREMMRAAARRWAKPGITYDENAGKDISLPQGGVWIGYIEPEHVEAYRRGERLPSPVNLRDYYAYGRNLRCGNTNGHEEGRGYWLEYAVTFAGEFIPVD